MDGKKALLLVGSPRKGQSTSGYIGQYLIENLKKQNYEDKTIYINDIFKNETSSKEFVDSINESDVIILTYPLYVDSLPASCIRALEYLTEEREKEDCNRKQKFLAVGNCGFYEKKQIENSLNVCRFFAEKNMITWLGGVGVGGGPQLQGRSLTESGGMTKRLRQALDMISDSIIKEADIPLEKLKDMTNPPEPEFVYFMIANLGFKYQAKRNGVLKNINDKSYISQ
jgi:multimeric flavodoxin WrbA